MKHISLIALIVALLIFAVPAFAQEVPPEIPVMPLDEALALLSAALSAVLVGLLGSPVTLAITSLLKRIPALFDVPANALQFGVALALAILVYVLQYLGLGEQAKQAYNFLLVLLPALAGLFTNLVASAVEYHAARPLGLWVLGYQRPAWVSVQRAERMAARASDQTVKPFAAPVPRSAHDGAQG
jgi:hypothetical protein